MEDLTLEIDWFGPLPKSDTSDILYAWLSITPQTDEQQQQAQENTPPIIVGRFLPRWVPELLDKKIAALRVHTKQPRPYTFLELSRLCVERSLLSAPDKNDPALYRDDPILAGLSPAHPLYALRRAFLYRAACKTYNHRHHAEKEVLNFIRDRIGLASPAHEDFVRYLAKYHYQDLASFFRPWRLPILEEDRKRHTIITGKSGYGKSNLLKVFVYNYIQQKGLNGIILLDPHGDVALEVAQLKQNLGSERLVYIDPFLHPDYTPVFNPFDLPDKSPEAVDLASDELIAVFGSVLRTGSVPFTTQMEVLLKPCISALMLRNGSTIMDLMDFMDDTKNDALVRFALAHLDNPAQLEFFRNDFRKDTYDPTKQAIRTRIMMLLQSHAFYKFLVGKSTIQIKQEMDRGAVLVFNLSTGNLGEQTAEAIGRFLIGYIQSIAQQRIKVPETKRQPVHLFIDECELFISEKVEKILKESRKFKLYLTMAQQIFGQKMSADLKQALIGNTAVKITGSNGMHTLKLINSETGADLQEMQNLKKGEFHVKAGERPSVKIKVPSLSDKKHYMSTAEWEETKKQQLARYYRKVLRSTVQTHAKREAPQIDLEINS